MYAVEVRDHVMIAHSLPDPAFGPAQGLHGATYVVDAAFFAETLDAHGIVIDIGQATAELAAALAPLRYANLDALPAFGGRITTTEVLCRHVFDALAAAVGAGRLGGDGRPGRIRVTLHESHVARAWFEADL
jgi:6-pyruvoyl-tetrahydropterin synthase